MVGAERLGHPFGQFSRYHHTDAIRLSNEVAQEVAARRAVKRHGDGTELAEAPDGPDEFGTERHHDRDVVALADAALAESIGITVGEILRLGIGKVLPTEDQPGGIADARGLV